MNLTFLFILPRDLHFPRGCLNAGHRDSFSYILIFSIFVYLHYVVLLVFLFFFVSKNCNRILSVNQFCDNHLIILQPADRMKVSTALSINLSLLFLSCFMSFNSPLISRISLCNCSVQSLRATSLCL